MTLKMNVFGLLKKLQSKLKMSHNLKLGTGSNGMK